MLYVAHAEVEKHIYIKTLLNGTIAHVEENIVQDFYVTNAI